MGRQLGWNARSGLSHTEIIEFTLNMENINQTVGWHGRLDPVLAKRQALLGATREGVRLRNVCGRPRELIAWSAPGTGPLAGATAVRVNVR